MAKRTMNSDSYDDVKSNATRGGTQRATSGAEEQMRQGKGIDPLVDPKGPAHLGPIRRSLPRFEKQGDLWLLSNGWPMSEETLLDTTGSMGDEVDNAFEALPKSYEMVATGKKPIFSRYDVQIASATFNDVEDNRSEGIPILCRSQFEMDERIALQMTHIAPGRNGHGNGKEDSHFGIFGAAYLTDAAINRFGLKYYHYAVSDEPTVLTFALTWLKKIFGDDVLDWIKENGFDFNTKNLPDTAQTVEQLQTRAHAFFLQVGNRLDVTNQWTDLYGADHVVMLPGGTTYLHGVKAAIGGLTEGVLDLKSALDFLTEHKIPKEEAKQIVRAVAHIPLGAQKMLPNFDKIPKAGDIFLNKTDLAPITSEELKEVAVKKVAKKGGPKWL